MAQLKPLFLYAISLIFISFSVQANPDDWKIEWPDTDFSKSSVSFEEILSGGPPKDGIPPIDHPKFLDLIEINGLQDREGIISVTLNGETKGYPLRILMWHEIVNDTLGGVPIAVTYCPLCNSALVFERKLADGRVLDFGTTGKLRNSDLVMYDRQSESWWQQFTGKGIVGEMNGIQLNILPARMESWSNFTARFNDAKVLVPNDPDMRNYGRNPYVGYALRDRPFMFDGQMPSHIAPMESVLVIEDQAWSIEYLKKNRLIEQDGLKITWASGQSQAVEGITVFHGQDIGNVVVQKNGQDVPHHLTFAFAFHAFHPQGTIYQGFSQ